MTRVGSPVKKRRRGNSSLLDKKNRRVASRTPPIVKLLAPTYPFHCPSNDSGLVAQRAFQWLISPLDISDFFADVFEKKPTLFSASHTSADRFTCLASVQAIKDLIVASKLYYSVDVDITHYNPDTGRRTYNGPSDKRTNEDAWKLFTKSHCSVRLLRPQEHFDAIWALCSMLESFFGTVAGANTYLTPPDSQGFAPHYDDIDAFVCQVSGCKRWRVYSQRPDGYDALPRHSSIDFSRDDMKSVKPVIDAVLKPGDMLYLPRGAIHEAECYRESLPSSATNLCEDIETESSLHVTFSTCQRWTWADFLTETFRAGITSAATDNILLRRTLPLRFTDFVGVGFAEKNPEKRNRFDKRLRKSIRVVSEAYPIDSAADMLARRFMRERLPPWDAVRGNKVAESGKSDGLNAGVANIQLTNWVRLVGRGVARVIMDTNGELPCLIHCMDNTRGSSKTSDSLQPLSKAAQEDRGEEMSCTPEEGLAIDSIIQAYPEYVLVADIPLEKKQDRIELVECLLEMRIVHIQDR